MDTKLLCALCVLALSAAACGNSIDKKVGGPIIVNNGATNNGGTNNGGTNNGGINNGGTNNGGINNGGTNNGGTNNGGVDGPVSVSQETLTFDQASLTSAQMMSFNFTNTSNENLTVALSLTEELGDADANEEFLTGEGWKDEWQLAPGEASEEITILYVPTDLVADSGQIEIRIDGTVATAIQLVGDVQAGDPEMTCPSSVIFTGVGANEEDTRLTEITNVGTGPLQINDVLVDGEGADDIWWVTYPEENDPNALPEYDTTTPPSVIDVDDTMYVRVHFYPYDADPAAAILRIDSNDPNMGTCDIELLGNP